MNYRVIKDGNQVGIYEVTLSEVGEILTRDIAPVELVSDSEEGLLKLLSDIQDDIHDEDVIDGDLEEMEEDEEDDLVSIFEKGL